MAGLAMLSGVVIAAPVGCGEATGTGGIDGDVSSEDVGEAKQAVTSCITITRASGPGSVSDTQIANSPPFTGNFGGSQVMNTGLVSSEERQTLLKFNLSAIPPGTTVISADLSLALGPVNPGVPATINVHRVTAPWIESVVSWQSFGGAYSPVIDATMSNGAPVTTSIQGLVQGWVQGTYPNEGILLEQSGPSSTQFSTSESSAQPSLTVCYDSTCAPGFADCNNNLADGCEAAVATLPTSYRDADGDGYGDPGTAIQACSVPAGYVTNNTDCDDSNAAINPGAVELCNVADDNCNGVVDEGCGITVNPQCSSAGGFVETNPSSPARELGPCPVPDAFTLSDAADLCGASVRYFSYNCYDFSDGTHAWVSYYGCCVGTCNDDVQNQNETGVDCGGVCPTACPTCNDGLQNGNETGTDCGGSCAACPTCNDGIQNQDETSTDCGGTICPACAPTCGNSTQVVIDFEGFAAGASVEGLGTVNPNLKISTNTGKGKIIASHQNPYVYAGPNGGLRRRNGCLGNPGGFGAAGNQSLPGKGFADTGKKHKYTFTFAPGVEVSQFSLLMLDFGDYNPNYATYHEVNLTAYDVNGAVVDQDRLAYTSGSGVNPRQSTYGDLYYRGDACRAQPGRPGNFTFNVQGSGIVKVTLTIPYGIDPNIAFDNLTFTPCAATCSDGIQNQGETGVDCGGPCGPCFPASCKEILAADPSSASGNYIIDPDGAAGPIAPFTVFCDMTTNGGGWTAITTNLARFTLGGTLVAVDAAFTQTMDASGRPCTRDHTEGHTYHYTFKFPAGFTEFYLDNYQAKSNPASGAASDIFPGNFHQTNWNNAHSGSNANSDTGDISFGSGSQAGPKTSWAQELSGNGFFGANMLMNWPGGSTPYTLNATSTAFRIGWGETGAQDEGFCPWWTGTIMLR